MTCRSADRRSDVWRDRGRTPQRRGCNRRRPRRARRRADRRGLESRGRTCRTSPAARTSRL